LGVLATGLVSALGQGGAAPVVTALQPGDPQITVTVAVADWVKQLTLESRTNVEDGTWLRRTWQRVSGAGTITFPIHDSEKAVFFRARGDAAAPFLDRVATGLALITTSYPEAVLYEVDATGTGPTSDPTEISQLRIVCSVNGGTALIASTDWFTFGPVDFVPQPWLGDMEIPWPVNLDVMEADILLQGAGYQGPFQTITLRHPVYPGLNEPYYIFGMTTGQYVFVGVDDKKVFLGQ
jgi:hypothetical protein